MVALPQDKVKAYIKQIEEILVANKVTNKNLQSIIGRIERTSYVVPNAKYFINRLRHLQYHSVKQGWAYILTAVQHDLIMYVDFIRGTSINN